MSRKLWFLFSLIIAAVFLLFPDISRQSVLQGLRLCGTAALPALFPFFVLSDFWIRMNFADALRPYFFPIMHKVYRLPGSAAAALFLGCIGGYPIGARTAARLYESGSVTRTQAHHILSFCNNAGPAFVVGIAGFGVFGSAVIGAVLYGIHLLSALLLGVLMRPKTPPQNISPKRTDTPRASQAWTDSIGQGAETALRVCGFILFFSAISGFVQRILPSSNLSGLLLGSLELTAGITWLKQAALTPLFRFIAAAFLLGTGGLCVIMQSLSVIQSAGLSGRSLIKGKLMHGILSALMAAAAAPLLPLSAPCFFTDAALISSAVFRQWAVFLLIIAAMGAFLKNTSGKLSHLPL